jgi:hypothetical protein
VRSSGWTASWWWASRGPTSPVRHNTRLRRGAAVETDLLGSR